MSYVVARQRTSLAPEQLREFLRQSLPEYMIPAVFVQLDRFPLTTNGKVDRHHLPRPEQRAELEQVVVADPRSPIEEILLEIWRDLLSLSELGIHDHFFQVGGHSLLATRVMARIQAVLQVTFPVQLLFEAPTVAELAQRVEQALRKGEGRQEPPLVARERPEEIPLSFAQQRLWFLDLLEPGSTVYLVPRAQWLLGNLDTKALEQSLQEFVRRHEILRTTFEERAGQPVQVIHPAGLSPLPVIDLQGLVEEEREQQARRLASQERQRPCDLATGPLLRTYLLRLELQKHVLLLTLHHIITDGWSNGVLIYELTTLYQANLRGQSSPLAPLPIQYADYALWQRAWLQDEALEAQLAYWRTQLAGIAPLELPIDHPRPPVQTYRGTSQGLPLSPILSEQLVALSRRQNVTLFMLLLAALQVLLARYTGQHDISVGSPIANRRHAEIEEMIGFFVNTLVLRTDLSGNPTFEQILQRVRKVCLGAYVHQDVPFEKVVEELEPERDLSRSPLFQVMFVLHNTPRELGELAGVSVKPLSAESQISKFDLTLSMAQTEQGLRCWLEYNCDLFEPETITRLLLHWQTLLEGVVHNPQAHLSDLPLLTAVEQEQLLVEWNATLADYPSNLCVHQLFEQQVTRTPDAVALVFEQEQVTYQTLNQSANQLAHHLQELGVGPEVLVGICMDRSIEMVMAILGVLKAGGAYVPLDPGYPDERLAFLLQDADVFLLLVQQHHLKKVLASHHFVICLQTAWPILREQPQHNLLTSTHVDHLAYVMHTSGSTGQPKGVMISHRAIANRLLWGLRATHLATSDRTLQIASFSFDISLWEIFGPLLAGACLVQAPPQVSQDSTSLLMLLQQQQITVAHFVPTLLNVLLEPAGLRECTSLRCVLYGGETSAADLPGRFFAQSHQGQLQQFYGPTEASINATCWVSDRETLAHLACLGRPITNMQVYLLDPDGQPVPIGCVGEIYLGGVGLARGYFKRPDLSAERFVPHLWSQEPGARLYRTGDLGRYRSDGTLEFVGRKDQQVKIRGYRIELGEIETVIQAHPAVQQGVVLAREDVPGEKRLVAYVIGSQDLNTSGLRRFLQEKLPGYMIPSQFLRLDAMPLTPNGKVDRRALPAPQQWDGQAGEEQQQARTGIEEVLVDLWSQVLGRAWVGIHDTFFELGGHSLLATQLLARVRVILGVELPVRTVFEAPTVAAFAQRVEQALRQGEDLRMPALVARERPEVLPLSFAQQRLWFLDQLEPDSPTYLVPHAIRIDGKVDVPALQSSLQELISRHESLRTTFEQRDGQPMQVIHPVGSSPLPVIDLQGLAEQEREQQARQLASQERQHPCDLATGPLLRTTLLRLMPEEHVFLQTLHHIVTDGWSNGVLMHELTTLYQAKLSGEPCPLAPLPVQYADYALWQRAWLQGEVLQAQLTYWRSQLAGIAPLELPTDHARPPVQTSRGARQVLPLSPVLSEQLQTLSGQHHVTLFMLLLAAWQVLLARYTGQGDISVGTPIANRRHAELEGVIGFFVNTLVLRTDLSGNPTFDLVLQRVRQVCLEAYAHQDVPFEKVVEELEPQRDLSRSPLFQVMLVLQNTPQEQADWPGMEISSLGVESTMSKFDLTLSMVQTEQGLGCWLEYNTDLFEAGTITRMLSHWQTLLEAVVHNPQVRVSDVPLLTATEREYLLETCNATQREYPCNLCVHELFEQQVERTPDAVALVSENEVLTYDALNRHANQLAHHLQDLGVGPEVLVGICLERSLKMVIGLLSVLKAGGAYVPLDPTYPRERLACLLEDCQASLLLTQQRLATQLFDPARPFAKRRVIDLDHLAERSGQKSAENLQMQVHPEHLAYVIYTSGSTGRPKGVLVAHRNLVHSMTARFSSYPEPVKGSLLPSSFAFDSSMAVLFWTLCQGGTLCLPQEHVQQDPQKIIELIAFHQLSHLMCVSSFYTSLLASTTPDDQFVSLQEVIIGGEACLSTLVSAHQELLPRTALSNEYGPTETTVWATVANCLKYDFSRSIPIGRPILNMQVYVLDDCLQPVPIGVIGELYVGGVGVTRGYLGCADLTAERFVPHPWSQQPGARFYRTGDLGRYWSDGTLEFVGRKDQQVKIRGYRIELGEIEAALGSHPEVQECVVLVREDVPGDKRLVAYMVGSRDLIVAGLRGFLQEKLPGYMIPSQFLRLDAMPLTPNGKLDRRALPAPQQWHGQAEEEQQQARTGIEEVLVDLWSQVLGRARVGIHDTFFELGGHSLLATQLLARVRTVLGVELPVRTVFEAPTVATFAQRVEQALRQGEGAQIPPLVTRARPEVLPLSFAQQRLWFLDQLEPGSVAYLAPSALRMGGKIAVPALQDSLQELVSRHESLRTTFEQRDGQPVQVIHLAGSSPLPVIDLQGLGKEEREQQARQLASQERQHPCDLATGPLLRTTLLRLMPEEHVLLQTLHHIITDGWSNEILVRELTMLYQAKLAGEPSPLAPLPVQYADYALWQRAWLQGEVLEAQLAYWRVQLAGVPPLELPTDHPRPPVQTYRGTSQMFQLPPVLSEQLVALSEQQNVTLFMLLLAALQVLLARYTGQRDICVGTPIANRRHAQIEGVIGFFVNTLVLRTDLSGDPTFLEVLQRVREMCLGAYAHQEIPFEKVVEELQPERDLSRSPLFQVMLVLQNAPREQRAMTGMRASLLEVESTTSKFDLTLSVRETKQGLSCALGYNRDLFEPETITRMLSHWQTLLEAVVDNLQVRVSDVPLLTATEREYLLETCNATQREYPCNLCVHELFEQQVGRTPDAVALVFEDKVLTYDALNRHANQLAHHLQKLGVGPEVLVGICMERSLEMVIGLLGILKAGGAYVPLDPSFPQDRITSLLEDCQPAVVLTQEYLRSRLPVMEEALSLDTQWEERVSGASLSNPSQSTSLENLAYVIYTSGSTGRPKGVMNTHSGLRNRLHWMQQAYQLTNRDCVLHKTPFSFDVSVWEFFWPLFTGARLVLAIPGGHQDPAYLQSVIVEQGITTLHFVPAMLQLFLQESGLEQCRSLRHVFSSGEALTPELQANFFLRFSSEVGLHNLYGPTEAAIDVTSWECQLEASSWVVPIGRPIANIQIYILDETMRLVPIGVIGELCIAGVGLARGYSGRADLTAEKFLANPFAQQEGERLYRTGDLARYRSDGAIEYVGRRDQQVKIRGYRIELGEIETILRAHPSVQEGVVLVREDVPDDKRLVAYVVGSQDLATAELRSFLQEKLPAYMIPSQFLLVDAIPLTAHGKVNRQQLAAANKEDNDALLAPVELDDQMRTIVQPRDAIEWQLLQIWEDLLQRQPLSVCDDFFKLGGHSLLAVRLMSHITKHFRQTLDLATLFQHSTVAELAVILRQQTRSEEPSPLVAIQAQGSRPPFFCVHPSGGTAFCYVNLARRLGPDQPFYGLQTPHQWRSEQALRTIEEIAASYLALIQTVQPQGPYLLGGWSSGGVVALEMAQQLQRQGDEVGLLAILDSQLPNAQLRAKAMQKEIDLGDTGVVKELIRRYEITIPDDFDQRELDAQLSYAVEQAKKMHTLPVDVSLEFVRHSHCVRMINKHAAHMYVPQSYPHQIDYFAASDSLERKANLDEEEVSVEVSVSRDHLQCWREVAQGGMQVHVIPGNHLTIVEEPNVQVLADTLRSCIDRVCDRLAHGKK